MDGDGGTSASDGVPVPAMSVASHPPMSPVGARLARATPVWPTVLGVIALVMGALGILGGMWSVISPHVLSGIRGSGADAQVFGLAEGWVLWYTVGGAINVVLSVWQFVAGIGLVRRRGWAPGAARWWAVLAIAHGVLATLLGFLIAMEQLEAFRGQTGPAISEALMKLILAFGLIVGFVWWTGWPAFMLMWLSRSRVKEEAARWR